MYRQEFEILYRDRIEDGKEQPVYFSGFNNDRNENLPDATLVTKKGIVRDARDRLYPLISILNDNGTTYLDIMSPVDLFTVSEVKDMIEDEIKLSEVDVFLNDPDINRKVAFHMRAEIPIRLGIQTSNLSI